MGFMTQWLQAFLMQQKHRLNFFSKKRPAAVTAAALHLQGLTEEHRVGTMLLYGVSLGALRKHGDNADHAYFALKAQLRCHIG